MNKTSKKNREAGFTLIEILVAVTIFGIFIAMTSTSLAGIISQQQKTNVLRLAQQNTRNILESISREGRSANGEFDKDGNRTAHAFGSDSGKLIIVSTDMTQKNIDLREVTKTEYFLDGSILKKSIFKKKVGEAFGSAIETVGLNSAQDLKIMEFTFIVDSDGGDFMKPPAINDLKIRSESEKGMGAANPAMRTQVELQTSVTSRGY